MTEANLNNVSDCLAGMELELSETTEDFAHEGVWLDPKLAYGVPVDGSLVEYDGGPSEGPQEPEYGCCLAEPEPPEEE